MHTMKLRLKMDSSQERVAEKRFRAMWHVHNQLVKHMIHKINEMRHDRGYKKLLDGYKAAKDAEDEERREQLGKELTAVRERYGITKTKLEGYAKVMQKNFSSHLSSQQVQKEADRVWEGVEKVLFGDGEELHFKKLDSFRTISSKSMNGCHYADPLHPSIFKNDEIVYPKGQIIWMGETIKVDVPWDDAYTSFSMDHDISYCEIKREPFPNGWHYYVILYLDGPAPAKHLVGKGTSGLDAGVSTMCACSESRIQFDELAPGCKGYNEKIAHEQQKIESSKRTLNPDNYNADGTIKKGKHGWIISGRCRAHQWREKSLYRQKAAYVGCSHDVQVNRMLSDSRHFIVEHMDYQALAKRSKGPAERSGKESAVKKKDGSVVKIHKFKKKRRFGASVRDRSPGSFLRKLKELAVRYGGSYEEVDNCTMKASQYDHVTDTCEKVPLGQRYKMVGGHYVLRDPYSSFLLRWADAERKKPDRGACAAHFDQFLEMQTSMMLDVIGEYPERPACFGF